jgi:hypothetical protein
LKRPSFLCCMRLAPYWDSVGCSCMGLVPSSVTFHWSTYLFLYCHKNRPAFLTIPKPEKPFHTPGRGGNYKGLQVAVRHRHTGLCSELLRAAQSWGLASRLPARVCSDPVPMSRAQVTAHFHPCLLLCSSASNFLPSSWQAQYPPPQICFCLHSKTRTGVSVNQ